MPRNWGLIALGYSFDSLRPVVRARLGIFAYYYRTYFVPVLCLGLPTPIPGEGLILALIRTRATKEVLICDNLKVLDPWTLG